VREPGVGRRGVYERRTGPKSGDTTAATQQTEPEVVAAIAPGDGHAISEQAIRERAYAIWQEEGRPEACHLNHWPRAEAEINRAAVA
jgi:hypothetical protein